MRTIWYTFGAVAVTPTRYGTVVVDAADLPQIESLSWHVRAGKHLYVRAWLDSRRASVLRGNFVYLHKFVMNPGQGELVDFKNGNGLDCRRENLRLCDKTEDSCNRRVTRSSSGFLGGDFDKARGKWRVQLRYRGRHHMLGRFDSLDEAIAVRGRAADEMHGEFASTLNAELLNAPTAPAPG